jgi:hypothetical protein
MTSRSENKRSSDRYTIYDLMDATTLSRSALLNVINGRRNRGTAALIPMREKKLQRSDTHRWIMTYSHRAYLKVIRWAVENSRKSK